MLARQAEPRPGPFTFEEYLAWEAEQDEKWELVDGHVVRRSERWHYDPVTGVAGATWSHNRIQANLIVALNNRLRGSPCVALPSEIKTRSRRGNARYPDVTVECGRASPASLITADPRIVFEVLSASNTPGQQLRLLSDYQSVETLRQIVYLEQGQPFAVTWSRLEAGWSDDEELYGVDRVLSLPSLGVTLPLADIYEGVEFTVVR